MMNGNNNNGAMTNQQYHASNAARKSPGGFSSLEKTMAFGKSPMGSNLMSPLASSGNAQLMNKTTV